MRGGHNRKPTGLKVLEGTARPDRAGANAPKPRPIAPKCPDNLDEAEQAVWHDLAPKLERLGLLTEADGWTFALLCQALIRHRRAADRLRTALQSPDPEVIRRAETSVEKAEFSVRQLSSEFGLTPASRSRLNVPHQPEEDELEEFLRRK